jgi:oligopeptide transport system ATP-binding protein
MSDPLLAVRQLHVQYALSRAWPWQHSLIVRAVDDVNFNLGRGETLGIVGESGCGKSTLARALVGLQPIARGAVLFDGRDLARLDARQWRALRRDVQMVFQDPLASLDPRMTIGATVEEPLLALCPELSAAERRARVVDLLERVGLSASVTGRYPHEFSGGACQRVGIARALVVRPRLLICDEPTSALDASVQSQVLNLLAQLQRDFSLSMILIAHDLAVVRHLAQRVMVMYLGRVMEQAPADELFRRPAHPYSRALLAAVPGADREARRRQVLDGELPSAMCPPPGCAFASRCPMADERCTRELPHFRRLARGSAAACHYAS